MVLGHGDIGTAFVSTESHRRRVERRVLHSAGGLRYVVLSMNGATSVEKQIARFLEMTSFGPTRSEIDVLLLSSSDWGPESRGETR